MLVALRIEEGNENLERRNYAERALGRCKKYDCNRRRGRSVG